MFKKIGYVVASVLLGVLFFFASFYGCTWTCNGLECLRCLVVIYLAPFFLLAGFFVSRMLLIVDRRVKTKSWVFSRGDKILTGITLFLAVLIVLGLLLVLK